MEIRSVQPKSFIKGDPEKVKEQIAKLRKEYQKPVKGRFEFIDAQGGYLEFNWRFFPEDILATYKIYHGEVTDLPMGIVKHLNNTYKKIRTFEQNLDNRGNRGVSSTYERISRVRFIPEGYGDEQSYTK